MSSPNRITVVINVRNGERYLEETLRSLAVQTAPVSILLVDNQSIDGTERIARNFPGVTYVRTPEPFTLGGAREFSLSLVESEFVAWLDADDLWEPRFAECCLRAMDSEPGVVMATTGTICIDQDGKELSYRDAYQRIYRIPRWRENADEVVPGDSLHSLLVRMRHRWAWCAYLFRTEPLKRVGGFDPLLVYATDVDLIGKALRVGKALHVPANLTKYRRHLNQETNRLAPERMREEKLLVVLRLGEAARMLDPKLAAQLHRVTELKGRLGALAEEKSWSRAYRARLLFLHPQILSYLFRLFISSRWEPRALHPQSSTA